MMRRKPETPPLPSILDLAKAAKLDAAEHIGAESFVLKE
jgi:hypothetical protein